jgi:hypothetical protein
MIIIIHSDALKITHFGKIHALHQVGYYYLLVITKYNIIYCNYKCVKYYNNVLI